MKRYFGLVVWLLAGMAVSLYAEPQKKALIIESYHPDLAWTHQCEQGIIEVLGKDCSVSAVYMDTKRVPEKEFALKAEMAWKTYQALKPDLVFIGDDNALKLLGPRFAKTDVPVVFFGINDNPRNYFDSLPANMTGILERTPVIPWVRHLERVVPWARNALILMDRSLTSEAILDVVFQGRKKLVVGRVSLEYRLVGDMDTWKKTVLHSKKMDYILMPTFHAVKNGKGAPVSPEEVVAWTSANSQVPVFTNQDYAVWDKGGVGAYVLYGKAHGKMAAKIALDILEKRSVPARIPPVTDRDGAFYFNRKQLKRFGLVLPADMANISTFK